VLVQVTNKRETSLSVRPTGVVKTSRLGLGDLVASGVKCGPHGGKNSVSPDFINTARCHFMYAKIIFHR
jgi:hypothetical protein